MQTVSFGCFEITNAKIESGQGFFVSTLSIRDRTDGQVYEVKHFQFLGFKGGVSCARDHSITPSIAELPPDNSGPILSLLSEVQTAAGRDPAPIVVHDDFGLGRSGIFIAIDHGMWRIKVCRTANAVRA